MVNVVTGHGAGDHAVHRAHVGDRQVGNRYEIRDTESVAGSL